MNPALAPTLVELSAAVRSVRKLVVLGAGTKLRSPDVVGHTLLSTRNLRGIVEYEPEEFVLSALAGTPLREIVAELARHDQYLPFDPLLAGAGATLGGMVATGTNGPGRFRYGGVRDFILGVRFADGDGQLLRAGSKVVKNAAGFDLPKFFIGSRGGFGLLVEITLKVFPAPRARLTLQLPVTTAAEAAAIMHVAARSRWQPHALDYAPAGGAVLLEIAGPAAALHPMAREILDRWPGTILTPEQAAATWTGLKEMHWAHADGPRFKLATPLAGWPEFRRSVVARAGGKIHITSGGDTAYASWPVGTREDEIHATLKQPGISFVRLDRWGPVTADDAGDASLRQGIKAALDPVHRFFQPDQP